MRVVRKAFIAIQVVAITGLIYFLLWTLGRIAVPALAPVFDQIMRQMILASIPNSIVVEVPDLILRSIVFFGLVCGLYSIVHLVLVSPRLARDVAVTWDEAASMLESLFRKTR